MAQGQEAIGDSLGNLFDLHNNGIVSVLIRIASLRRF